MPDKKDKIPKCKYCGSTHVWKRGKQPTVKGPRRMYVCVKCGRSFPGGIVKEEIKKR